MPKKSKKTAPPAKPRKRCPQGRRTSRDKTSQGSRIDSAGPARTGSSRALEAIAGAPGRIRGQLRPQRLIVRARPTPSSGTPTAACRRCRGVSRVELGLLKGIDRMRDILIENTERFANGLPANNALLWGARGMGKSSLVKAAHASINATARPADRLKLIEIHREDIESLPALMDLLRGSDFRFIVFCDDLSFDGNDASYKSLKAVLEGGIEGRPDNVILYATSNRRHLLAREMIENERSTAINPGEAVEEKVSLSDRFGLWLGFHRCSQDEYLAMVRGYCSHFGIKVDDDAAGARGAGMVDHARLALGPRRLAVRAGARGAARREADGELAVGSQPGDVPPFPKAGSRARALLRHHVPGRRDGTFRRGGRDRKRIAREGDACYAPALRPRWWSPERASTGTRCHRLPACCKE